MEEKEKQLEYLERIMLNQQLIHQEHQVYLDRLNRLSSMMKLDPLLHLEMEVSPAYFIQYPHLHQTPHQTLNHQEGIMETDKLMGKMEMETAKEMEQMEEEVVETVEEEEGEEILMTNNEN
jgi:hypothetical protein